MNRTPLARRTQIINCLVEGNSIRSTERMTDTHRDTIMRLMVEVGDGCAALMDEQMRDLPIAGGSSVTKFGRSAGKKQTHMPRFDDRAGSAISGRLLRLIRIPSWSRPIASGSATRENAVAFMTDLSERLSNRVQISSDALRTYVDAVERAFGADVDYGQIVKFYDAEPIGPRAVRPAARDRRGAHSDRGKPDQAHISTSLSSGKTSRCG